MLLFRKSDQPQNRGRRPYKRTPVTTYYRSKTADNQTSPFTKKTPKKRSRRFLLGILDLVLLGILFYGLVNSLLLSPNPKVSVTDLSYRSLADYQQQVKASFAGVNNRTKVTFDEQSVSNKIQKKFPEVQATQIELPFFDQHPRVKLVISPPAFKMTNQSQAVIVDSQGMSVANSATLPSIQGLPTVTDQGGFDIAPGKPVLSSQSVGFIQDLIKQCQRAKIPVSSLTLPPRAQELDLRTSDQPYYVKFFLGGDVNIETGQFLATRQKFSSSSITPSEYLDVRVAGKIFYK